MKFEVEFPDDFLSDLLASDFEEIARESLEEAAPLLQNSVQSACQSVIADKTRTDLVNSFKVWKVGVKKTKTDGYMIGVSAYGKPSEKSTWTSKTSSGKTRTRNTSNNDIAWWLEHGNAHQPAKPFMDRAAHNSQTKILEICQKIYNKKVGAK